MAADAAYHEPYKLRLPGFVHVDHADLAAMDRAIGDETAAVVLETVPATLGMPMPPEGYLAGIQALCRERGVLLVLDEVQTGLGRSGRMWCYEHDGVEPDVIVTGKGLGGGVYPIAATLMTPAVHRFYDERAVRARLVVRWIRPRMRHRARRSSTSSSSPASSTASRTSVCASRRSSRRSPARSDGEGCSWV